MKNGKDYIVIEQVEYDRKKYLYLVNDADEMDSKYVEVKDNKITQIDPNLFMEKIFPLFAEKMKNY